MRTRSMNQKIGYRLFFASILGFCLALVLSAFIFYNAINNQIWAELNAQTNLIVASYNNFTKQTDLSLFADQEVHITLFDESAHVLYESDRTPSQVNTSGTEAELEQAYQEGVGTCRRASTAFDTHAYYKAVLLPDGNVLRVGVQSQGVLSVFNAALPAILLSFVSFIVLALGIAHLLTRGIVTPIMDMTRDLEHMQNNVPYKELAPFVSAIYSDRLLRANNDKIRQEFTANVSHELKSPLTSISGYAELIEAGMAKAADIPHFATKIHTEALRMITLVEDILRLSQLDTMSESINDSAKFEMLNLYELGQECIERQTINARRAYITLSLKGDDAFINGNRKLLGELFQNLCDNAIRYNHPGGKVNIIVGRNQQNIAYLTVQDNGIGIPKESQGRIFERFYRVDKSHSKETGGTGLGLAIVKHIVLVHDGQITLNSEYGIGTEITVHF